MIPGELWGCNTCTLPAVCVTFLFAMYSNLCTKITTSNQQVNYWEERANHHLIQILLPFSHLQRDNHNASSIDFCKFIVLSKAYLSSVSQWCSQRGNYDSLIKISGTAIPRWYQLKSVLEILSQDVCFINLRLPNISHLPLSVLSFLVQAGIGPKMIGLA